MKKGAELLAMLRNQENINESDLKSNDNIKSFENQESNSQHMYQLTESNLALQQSPDSNFIHDINLQKGSNMSSLMIGDSPNYNNSTHHNIDTAQGNSLMDDQISSNMNQMLTHPQTPNQKRQFYQSQSRSKSLFFQQTTKKDQKLLSKKSSGITQSDKSSEREDENNNNLRNSHIIEQCDNTSNKDEFRRDTITESFNQLKPADSLFSTHRSPNNERSDHKQVMYAKDSKLYSSTSSTSIQHNLGDNRENASNIRKSHFTFGKSEKQIQDTPRRYDHRKKSFIFTNFIKHEDTDSEEKSQTTTNKQTAKVTPLKTNLNNSTPFNNNNSGVVLNADQGSFTNVAQKAKNPKKQRWNFAVQLKNINRFISKMRDQTVESNYSKLLPHHLNLINDKSYQQEGGSSQFFSHYDKYSSNNFLSKIPIFEPDDTLLITFKVIVILALIIEIFILPIEIGFQIDIYQENSEVTISLKIFPILLFIIDFICRMNTGYYQNGTFVEKRRNVILYFKSILILDIINIISLIVRISYSAPFLFIVFVLRVILMYLKCSDVSDNFSLLERYPSAYNLTKLAFILLLVGHVCGCGFHFITTIDAGDYSMPTWIKFYKYENYDIKNRYLLSIYYSTITMITVGYGDLTPQNQIERIYVICIVIISGTVFAYAVNMIGAIFQEKEKKIADYKQMKFDISNYMMNRSISKKTQLKVYNYLDYINKKENESPEKGQKILSLISDNLKNEVYKEFYGTIMTNQKLFHNKFSKDFIHKVSLRMEEKMYAPGEIVFIEGSQENPSLYYILKGKIEMFTHKGDKKHFLGYLQSGDSMGHRSFSASQPLEWSCVTAEVTHLVYITQKNFLECLKEFPIDQEVFTMNKDDIIFGQNRYMNPCYSCGKQTHMVIDCPLIHYQKNKQLFINRHLYSVPEKDRKKHDRHSHEKIKSLKTIKRVRNALKVIRIALEQSYFQNTQIRGSSIVLNDHETDKQFYFKMAKFKFNEENNLVIDSQVSGEESDQDYYESDMESDDDLLSENTQVNEIAELQEEEEQTENSPTINKRRNKNPAKTVKLMSSSSFRLTENDEDKQSQNLPLYKKTLANQTRKRQLQKMDSLNNSIDLDRGEEINASFLHKLGSLMDANSLQDRSDINSLKRQSTTKLENFPPILTPQKTDSNLSQTTSQNLPSTIPQVKIVKKSDRFKLNLQPIMLYKNFDDVLTKQPLDETLSPYQVFQDEKNYQKTVQDTNNMLFEHLNTSLQKLARQQSQYLGKKKGQQAQDPIKTSSFKNYQNSQTNSNNTIGQTSINQGTPLYRPSSNYAQLNGPLALSNQSSVQRQSKIVSIHSPQVSHLKRDNIISAQQILSQYVQQNYNSGNSKAGDNVIGKGNIILDPINTNTINQDKYSRNPSNTQLPPIDNPNEKQQLLQVPGVYNETITPTGLNQLNLQNLNILNQQMLQNINLNQLNIQNPQHLQLIQQIKMRMEEFSIPNFEAMKDYTVYYPWYNCGNVLKKILRKSLPIRKKRITLQGLTKASKGARRNSSLKLSNFPLLQLQQQ